MDEERRFLIISLDGDPYAIPISSLVEISAPREIAKDPKLSEVFEGRADYRGTRLPVISLRRLLRRPGGANASALLVIKTRRGQLGLLVDSVSEIIIANESPAPFPHGVIGSGIPYYRGVLRHGQEIVLLLNEDGLQP